jgi:hypothetical protein
MSFTLGSCAWLASDTNRLTIGKPGSACPIGLQTAFRLVLGLVLSAQPDRPQVLLCPKQIQCCQICNEMSASVYQPRPIPLVN